MLGFTQPQRQDARPLQKTQPKALTSTIGSLKSQPQQYDWEKEIESLDQREMELHQTQMKLIREQMTNFIRDLSGLKESFNEMQLQREAEAMQVQAFQEELHRDKQEMQTEIMATIEALQEDNKGHTSKLDEVAALIGDGTLEEQMYQNHSALEKSINQLQQAHGDHAQKHGKELAALRDAHDSHAANLSGHKQQMEEIHATIPERLAYLEQALGDSANQHTGKLETAMAKLDQLVGRVSACESQGASLGKMHSNLASDKDAKHASLQERVDYLEGMLGDSADKHAKELEDLRAAHDKHAAALTKHGKFFDDHKGAMAGHHATLQERVDEIESILGLHADKHGEGLAQAASKMDQLQSRLSSVEKFASILDELKRSHGNLAKEKQELAGSHAALKDRLDSMDKAFGDNFDKHGKSLQALGAAHEKHQGAMSKHSRDLDASRAERQAHHETLVGRLDGMEQLYGDSHDKHSAAASQLHTKCQSMMDRLAGVEKHGQHIGNLQRSHDALASKKAELESGHASMGDRVSYLEKMLGDSVEKHAKELRALKDSHSKHASDLDGLRGLHTKHATVDERMDYLEQCMGDSADKHAEELAQLKRSHDSLHGRMAASENHGSVLSELRKSHGGLADQKAQLERHHASLKERVDYLEGILNDSADKHSERIDAAHAKVTEMHGRLSACERFGPSLLELKRGHSELLDHKASMDSDSASMKERLDNMESLFGDATNRQTKELKGLKSLHDKHAAMLTKHASQLDGFASHQEHHATLPERMAYIEQTLGDSADKHMAELAELHKKVSKEQAAREKHHGSMKDLLSREQEERGNHHATLNERLDYLEGVIGTNSDKHAGELADLTSGHQKLTGELKAKGDVHVDIVDRVGKLEKASAESSDRIARQASATKAKFESMSNRLFAVKEAWGQETPRSA